MVPAFSSNCSSVMRVPVRSAARTDRGLHVVRSNPSVARVFGLASQRLCGMVLVFVGILLVSTFLLLPVGLGLALLGVALIAAPAGT